MSPSSDFAVSEEICLTAGGDRNLPISEYMTSFSGSSTFSVEVRPVEGLVDLNFSANCKRKMCVYIYILEINNFNVFFNIWRCQEMLFSQSKLFFTQGHFNNFPFQ